MIDIHIHSTHSDGSKTVREILQLAENIGLTTIAFTDHENCDAYEELKKIDVPQVYSGNIIKGIELKSQYKDFVMDILGYNVDPNNIKKYLIDCYKDTSREKIQESQLKEFYRIGKELGLVLRPIEELVWDKARDWGSIVFYNEMKSHIENKEKVAPDIWESFKNFKSNHYHIRGDKFYINRAKVYPPIEKIIEIIHKSGGKAFIAHIFEYVEIKDKIAELEKIVTRYPVDGIECYHSIFTQEENERLIKFTKEHNLLMSGGSDYHGKNKPDIELGIGKGNLKIPESILENWNTNKN